MKRYVLGFVFSPDLAKVYLIRKNRPEWQAGLLNGIGGKIELGETEKEAMEREALEESGYYGEWIYYGHMGNFGPYFSAWSCAVFYSVMKEGCEVPETREDEPITCIDLSAVPTLRREMISNTPALIFGALLHHNYDSPIKPTMQLQY